MSATRSPRMTISARTSRSTQGYSARRYPPSTMICGLSRFTSPAEPTSEMPPDGGESRWRRGQFVEIAAELGEPSGGHPTACAIAGAPISVSQQPFAPQWHSLPSGTGMCPISPA